MGHCELLMKWNAGDACGLFASAALKSDESRRFGQGTLRVCRAVNVYVYRRMCMYMCVCPVEVSVLLLTTAKPKCDIA